VSLKLENVAIAIALKFEPPNATPVFLL